MMRLRKLPSLSFLSNAPTMRVWALKSLRRRVVAGLASLALILGMASCSDRTPPVAKSPTARPGESEVIALESQTGKVVWRATTGFTNNPAAVDQSSVYTSEVIGASSEAAVRSLDRMTGQERWLTRLGSDVLTTDAVTISGSLLFVTVSSAKTPASLGETSLYAIDRLTGDVVWRFHAKDVLSPTPSIEGGVLFIAAANTGQLFALDAKSGDVRWKFTSPGTLINDLMPLFLDEALFVLSDEGSLLKLAASTGKVIWETHIADEEISALFAPSKNVAFVVGRPSLEPGLEGEAIHAVDLLNGEELWTRTYALLGERPWRSIDGLVYFNARDELEAPTRVLAVETKTGLEVWHSESGVLLGTGAESVVLAGSPEGDEKVLAALDAGSGRSLWTTALPGRPVSAVLLSGWTLYVGTASESNGGLVALDASTGKMIWNHSTEAPVESTAVESGGMIYITTINRD